MKHKTSFLLATAIAASLSFSAFTPAAFADDDDRWERGRYQEFRKGDRDGYHRRGPGGRDFAGRGGFVRLMCSEEGAARIEQVLDRMDDRMQLTDEQETLFEEFKTQALAAQTEYADNCIAPVRDGSGDMVDRLKHRQTNMTAMLAAMEDVIPAFEAFHDELTNEQKAALKPQRGEGRGMRGGPRFGN
jgi:hypothetical protein